jgi:hypothetical protein
LTPILVGVLCILVASAFAVWQLRADGGAIDSGDAVEIARDGLQRRACGATLQLHDVDSTRVSVTYREDLRAYVVDFALQGAGEIRPSLWAAGCYVVVDERSRQVREAYAYER